MSDQYSLWFADQDAARRGLIKGYSPVARSASLIDATLQALAGVGTYPWFARVPTASNIADGPSRLCFEEVLRLFPSATRRTIDWEAFIGRAAMSTGSGE